MSDRRSGQFESSSAGSLQPRVPSGSSPKWKRHRPSKVIVGEWLFWKSKTWAWPTQVAATNSKARKTVVRIVEVRTNIVEMLSHLDTRRNCKVPKRWSRSVFGRIRLPAPSRTDAYPTSRPLRHRERAEIAI